MLTIKDPCVQISHLFPFVSFNQIQRPPFVS